MLLLLLLLVVVVVVVLLIVLIVSIPVPGTMLVRRLAARAAEDVPPPMEARAAVRG